MKKCNECGTFEFHDKYPTQCATCGCAGDMVESALSPRTSSVSSNRTTLPVDSEVRKGLPLARGFLYYFPAAVAEVARLSQEANEKHNPGEEMHWARGKSMDHADCILRHQVEAGTMDTDGFLHDVKVAWRAMAQLQEALEARGAPIARGAR